MNVAHHLDCRQRYKKGITVQNDCHIIFFIYRFLLNSFPFLTPTNNHPKDDRFSIVVGGVKEMEKVVQGLFSVATT